MANKKLGQHFLKNKKILEIIAERVLSEKLKIVEIGPGHGELTEVLVKNSKNQIKIIAVEKDKNLVNFLNSKFKNNKNIVIKHGDILKILKKILIEQNFKNFSYKIVGNIPYYITGHLLKIISELEIKPKEVILLVQKEVAERIASLPPKMNLLSAITQFWSNPQILKYVSKKNFSPPPKVDSAILILKVKKINNKTFKNFCSFVKILFKQPRKTIINNLKEKILRDKLIKILEDLKISQNNRPQDLDMDTIIKMFKIIEEDEKK